MPFIVKLRDIFSYPKKKWKEHRNAGSPTAWNTIRSLITVIESGANAIGLPISGLKAFVDRLESACEERKEYAELAAQLNTILDELANHMDQPIGTEMTGSVKRIHADIEDEIKKVTERQEIAMGRRLIGAMEEANQIVDCYRRIDGYMQRLTLNANFSVLKAANEQTVYVKKQSMESRLRNMSLAMAAVFDSAESHNVRRRSCAPGTRTAQIKLLLDWAHDPEVGRTCWMNGMAGTGKTTIAYSVCETLKNDYQLAGSFFCSRTIPECRQVKYIIPSIAYQLARFSLPFHEELDKTLVADPDTHTLTLKTQYEKLIVEPLLKSQNTFPTSFIVVIDALDECENEESVGHVLDLLLSTEYTLPVRYIVSSRPEKEITRRMEKRGDANDDPRLVLYELDVSSAGSDIDLYMRYELQGVPLTNDQISEIVERCGSFFIYASTACRYIKQAYEIDEVNDALGVLMDSTVIPMEQDDKNVIDHFHVVGLKSPEQVDGLLKPLRSVLNVGKENNLVTPLHASFPDFMLSEDRSKDLCCERGRRHAEMAKVSLELISKAKPQFNICGLPSSHLLDSEVEDLDVRISNSIAKGLPYACQHWPTHLGFAGHQDKFVGLVHDFFSSRLLLWMEIMNLTKQIHYGTAMIQSVKKWCSVGLCAYCILHADIHNIQEQKAPEGLIKLVHDASQFVTVYANHPVSLSTPHIYVSMLPFWPPCRPVSAAYMPRTIGVIEPKGTAIARRRLALIATWKVSTWLIKSICLSADGRRLVAPTENSIEVYDTSTGESISSLTIERATGVHSVAISPDGTQVAFAKYRTAYIWNVGNQDTTADPFPNLTLSINYIAFSPDGSRVACGTDDGDVHIHALHADATSVSPLKGHTKEVTSIAFSPGGLHLASASWDKTVRVWDVQTGQTVGEPFKEHTSYVFSVRYSPDGSRLASASLDHSIQVRDVISGAKAPKPLTIHTPDPASIAFSPSGAFIASGSGDKAIRVYDARTGQIVLGPLEGHTDKANSVIFSPDSARLYSCSRDGTVRIWDVQDLGAAHTLPIVPALSSAVYCIRYSHTGQRLVSGSEDGTLHVWNVKTGELVMEPLRGHQETVLSVDYSHSNAYIASSSLDGTLRIWDALSGEDIHGPIKGHSAAVPCVRLSPDNSCIASGSSDGTVRIWDVTSGQQIVELFRAQEFHVITSVDFSPNEQQLAFSYGHDSDLGNSEGPVDGAIRVVDRFTGDTVVGPIDAHGFISSIEFSSDGMRLVSGSYDKPVRIWDVQTGKQLVACGEDDGGTHGDDSDSNDDRAHGNYVFSVAFSPNGRYVASGSFDETMCIWDAENGNLMFGPLKAHTSPVYCVKFSPDSSHVASCSEDGTIRFWSLASCEASVQDSMLTASDGGQQLAPNLERQTGSGSWSLGGVGWVVLHGHRVVWVPSDLRPRLTHPPEEFMIADRGCLILNLDGLDVGDKWQDCYRPSHDAFT
ncbi:WD40 repeat-like protein [Rhizoctonia solani]|uniref:WD40 repeat-like protein n=1 Tax=Rhizoctonia solani TaxID=456999 RepID=A0A8H7H9N3_9AGAM|nr:WD40 repeat-like protein [Rhizoctonia solani]